MELFSIDPIIRTSFTLSGLAFQQFQNSFVQGLYVKLLMVDQLMYNLTDSQRTISVSIGNDNMNLIKANVGLCRIPKNCYLSAYSPFVNDTRNNPISLEFFNIYNGMAVSQYTPDRIPPSLIYWDFNYVLGQIEVTFSETVYVAFFNYSGVTVCSNVNCSQGVALRIVNSPSAISDWSILPPNSNTVSIALNTTQLKDIKSRKEVLNTVNNSFIVLDYGVVVDTSNAMNRFQGINISHAIQARHVIYSTIKPICEQFTVNLTSQVITLSFSEVMDIASIQLNQMLLQSTALATSITDILHLSTSLCQIINTLDSDVILIQFLPAGFNLLKSFPFLAKSPTSVYVSFTSLFIKDIFGNTVVPIPTSNALIAAVYTADMQPPSLLSWSINMGVDQIDFVFSEPLEYSNIHISSITLSSQSTNSSTSAISYSLTSDSSLVSFDLNQATIGIGSVDANMIKSQPPLCISRDYCYISITPSFDNDVPTLSPLGQIIQNPLLPVYFSAVSVFTPDTIPPYLVSYTFNLNDGALSLTFSETMNSLTLNSTGLSFYDSSSGGHQVICSSYIYFAPVYSNYLTVYLPPVTFLNIKSTLSLSGNNFYMTYGNLTIKDMVGNGIVPGVRLQASSIIQDVTPPSLLAIQWNASTHYLTAYFNDAVSTGNMNLADFKLFSSSPTQGTDLSTALLLTTGISSNLIFDLSPMASILSSLNFGATQFSTHMYLSGSGDVRDASTNSNPNNAMSSAQAVTGGNGIYNFRINFNTLTFTFEFFYPLQIEAIDARQVALRDSSVLDIYPLSGYSGYSTSADGQFLTLGLTAFDANQIQYAINLTDSSRVSATIGETFITDVNGISLAAIQSVPCVQILYSEQPPQITSFFLDLGTGLLTLFFSKPVYVLSADPSALTLVYNRNLVNNTGVSLSGASIVGTSAISQTLVLSLGGGAFPTIIDQLYITHVIGQSVLTTFLSVAYGFVYDTAIPRNYLTPIPSTNAIAPLFITQDSTFPKLVSFNLDMELRVITLQFSKSVNGSAANVKFITLHQLNDQPLAPKTASYTLTNSVPYGLGPIAYVNISSNDFSALLLRAASLASSKSNTYMTLQSFAYTDITYRKNPVSTILTQYAIQVSTYIPDTLPPKLLYYDISLQNAFIVFYFSELINCSSVQMTSIHFQPSAFVGPTIVQYSLSNQSTYSCQATYASQFEVYLSKIDQFNIALLPSVLKTFNTTYLTLPLGFVRDPYGNPLLPISNAFALQPRYFYADSNPPTISYIFISNIQILSLVFNKPIDTSFPIDVMQITFYDGLGQFNQSYTLTSTSSLIGVSQYQQQFDINFQLDYLLIKKFTGESILLSTYCTSSFLIFRFIQESAIIVRRLPLWLCPGHVRE